MEAIKGNINPSEMLDSKAVVTGVKQVAIALYYKELITFEQCELAFRFGFVPTAPSLELLFKNGLILDIADDAFAFLAMRVLYRDMTLFN